MNKYYLFSLFAVISSLQITAQHTNNLSGSPYSLYGLGVANNTNTGKTNSLGNTGIALPSNTFINNLNPASFAGIPSNRFLFDFGLKAQKETLTESGNKEPRFNTNFSSLAIAFPVSKKSGIGISLLPYTNVGYKIAGLQSNIEGSTNNFNTFINGSGGINNFKISYGYRFNNRLRVGFDTSFLFGLIEEEEINLIGNSILSLNDKNNYTGVRLGFGVQYDITKKISFGAILNTNTSLSGEQKNTTQLDGVELDATDDNLPSFKLPLEIGVGLHTKLSKKMTLNIDYKKAFWNATNQNDNLGDYIDQHILGIGIEFIPKQRGLKYWENVEYRTGFNFDSGSLEIDDSNINNYQFFVGLGLPLNKKSNSMLNLGYSYGKKGTLNNGLIQENYHTLSINLSLAGIWFQERKID